MVSRIVADHAVASREEVKLRVPRPAIEKRTMEQHNRSAPTRLFVIEPRVTDLYKPCVRRVGHSLSRAGVGNPSGHKQSRDKHRGRYLLHDAVLSRPPRREGGGKHGHRAETHADAIHAH